MRLLYDARLAGRGLGISTFVIQLARTLVASGEVELVWLGDPALAPAGSARWLRADRRPYPLLDGPAGRALARRLAADVIHFTGNTGWSRPGAVASVLTLHDLIFLDTGAHTRALRQIVGHRYERRLVPTAARSADVLVVPSQTVAAQVRERLDVAREALVIHEGVSTPPSQGGQYPAAVPYIVSFAGRDPRKHTDAVVAAWRELATLPLRLELLAAGGMPPGLRRSLQPEVDAGLVGIHPHLPREQVWSLLTGASALVYPSSDEGFGLPVLEGMAAGTPVLSGIAPVTREIGGDALVELDPADIGGSIVAALRWLLDDPAAAASVRRRGHSRIRQFSWRATADAYLQAYREAIARHR
jgi:glycosyltransferase involved in cell wall biosynthesis